MSEIDQIVEVSITRETQSVSTASFQIPLILTEHSAFVERAKEYTDLEALAEDFASGTVTHTIAGKVFGQEVSPPRVVVGRKAVDPETWVDALTAVTQENNDWYCLLSETHDAADQEALADDILARNKIYGTSTADADTPTNAETDIGFILNAAGHTRTFVIYSPDADDDYPEAAWVGSQLPRTPGSNDWNLKSVSGVTFSTLTDNERTELRAKSVNMYTRIGGVNVFQDGDMADGRPIDEQILVDWVVARMQEAIYFRLINSLKIPFTRAGFTIIENEMRSVLAQGVANGGFANAPAPSVLAPDPLSISANQRSQRIAGDFSFTARFAGSVRKVIIKGTLTV